MVERLIETERARKLLVALINNRQLPFRISIRDGRLRSLPQNKLQWRWAQETAEQRGDVTADEVQREWKALIGCPLVAAEDESFAKVWSRAEAVMTWEERVEWMRFLPITSLMTVTQLKTYLDEVYRYNVERGIELTRPEDLEQTR
jgi:hypothetical protein